LSGSFAFERNRHRRNQIVVVVVGVPPKFSRFPNPQQAVSTPPGGRGRDKAQAEYVEDFFGAVVSFLGFHPRYADLARRLASAVADHATPVGSGTVARTKRIPVEKRAEAAVIAWMRHQTTGYDGMAIPRIKGKRREVRRLLARRSHELLDGYRRGVPAPQECPLQKALANRTSCSAWGNAHGFP
jgi:hypothetical protein